ncbi:flagellar biosynthetic protein FliO [Nocardioides sp.]|jgi:flagellar protein FliO/FliZ|uniref:flagellar biosynthetic protein FliO n=1 Tax=Nocardioides sp. TaxID=35761 RepID=UPI002C93C051|nr:flagellar biosynthetic protein FliO [Nocardioides sp.]HVX54321.1 flagellar biosynthetic protein FliO [Nocardioides sp.]
MTELALRLLFSLAVVIGLLLLLSRMAGKRFRGRAGAPIQVVHRQALTRGSGVAVVTVAGRVLVLGTTDHEVTLLTELEPEELELEVEPHGPAAMTAEEQPVRVMPTHRAAPQQTKDGPLVGSVLSPDTWRQALRVTRGTSRNAS